MESGGTFSPPQVVGEGLSAEKHLGRGLKAVRI